MMRTEPGQMQRTQGLLAPMGGIAGQPSTPEGAMFATVFGDPPPMPGEGEEAQPTADAGGNVWALIVPVSGPPRPGDAVLVQGFSGVGVNAASTNAGDPGLAAGGSRPLSAPPSVVMSQGEGAATAQMLGLEVSTLPVPAAVPVAGGGLAPSDETHRVKEGLPKDGPVTTAQTLLSPAGAVDGLVPDPSKRGQSSAAQSPGPDRFAVDLPRQSRDVGGEGGAIPAATALPATRALMADSGMPVVTALPAVVVPGATTGPSDAGPLAANDLPAPPAALPADQGLKQSIAPDAPTPPVNAPLGVPPSAQPAVTKAERVWLGRLHWQVMPGAGNEGNARDSMPLAAEGVATPAPRAGQDSRLAALPEAALNMAALQKTKLEEALPVLEPDLLPLPWSPGASPVPTGSIISGPLPASAVPQLAAAMVASLHQEPDGTTEIALSPDELGSVRLRLEADARDPDRMIVHLVFDRPETMDLFRRHADQLSEAIRDAGYAEARLDFGQSGGGADPQGGQAADPATPPPNTTESDQARITPGFDRPFPRSLADLAGLDLRL